MMFKINWKNPGPALGVVGIVVSTFFGLVGLVSDKFGDFAAQHWDYLLLWIIVLFILSWAILLRHENSRLKGKLDESKPVRWEQRKVIKYGHVSYHPFLNHDPVTHEPSGVGPRILGELLGNNGLVHYKDESSWENMFNGLMRGEFDVIATPLFETRSRQRAVAFSTPLFFADIGIFVRRDTFNGSHSLTHHEAEGFLKSIEQTSKAMFIAGEISQKMVRKYMKNIGSSEPLTTEKPLVHDLFNCLVTHSTDVVFAERFFARSIGSVNNGEVVNILKAKELLYPVGFAMRKQDYSLRNYINIKLMEFDDKHPDRLMGFIIDELSAHPGFGWIDVNNARDYFVRDKSV